MKNDFVYDEYTMKKEPTCCGGCIKVHTGIKLLGLFSMIRTMFVLISGGKLIYEDNVLGFLIIGINSVFIVQAYWYI